MSEILKVKELSVKYSDFELHPLSFELQEGGILAIIGESGSGKTTLAKAISCLLSKEARSSGEVYIDDHELLSMDEKERKALRLTSFSIAFQNSAQWLNPTMTLKSHLQEVLDRSMKREEQEKRMKELMEEVGLSASDLTRFPKELSGGMAQKFLLANAIALNPKLVILDEPTSSTDSRSRNEFIKLIRRLNHEKGIAFLIITHDLGIAAELSTQTIVLYAGHIVEFGKTEELLNNPRHPYTRGLINASICLNLAKDIWGIRQERHTGKRTGCPFCGRCTQSLPSCSECAPQLETAVGGRKIACNRGGIITVLSCQGISKSYGKQRIFEELNLEIFSGEIVSLVGKSGIGKTTLARILSGFDDNYEGTPIKFLSEKADFKLLHRSKQGVQMVFQDSEASLNPHISVFDAVSEPLVLSRSGEVRESVDRALLDVGLSCNELFLQKKITELSGGMKQRVSIARALTMEPTILIADEPTSMLDPSSSANLIRMLKQLQNSHGFSMLVITHDIECALKISDRIYLLEKSGLKRLAPASFICTNIGEIFEEEFN